MPSLLIRGGTIVSSDGVCENDVLIREGVIEKISTALDSADEIIDATGKLLFPGLIDCHVHFREPGFPDKATMASESAAALAGGVTTVCDMPNTNPPTVSIAALKDKVGRAAQITDVDIRFFFGVTKRKHLEELEKLWKAEDEQTKKLKKSCCGVKIYLEHSTGNQKIDIDLIASVFSHCGHLQIPIVAHCEDPGIIEILSQRIGRTDIIAHSALRPPDAEVKAAHFAVEQAREHEAQLHIAHVSTSGAVDLVRQAKADGLFVTCEVAPHHLFLSTDDYQNLGTLGKMNPPLRTYDHCEALWEGITDGTIDCIATDHAPHTLAEKNISEPLQAPSGVLGIETMMPLLLTVAAGEWPHPRSELGIGNWELSYSDIVRLCFDNPNKIFSLGKEKIAEGAKTPIVLIDPQQQYKIQGKNLHSLNKWTPYEGWKVMGKVEEVI